MELAAQGLYSSSKTEPLSCAAGMLLPMKTARSLAAAAAALGGSPGTSMVAVGRGKFRNISRRDGGGQGCGSGKI